MSKALEAAKQRAKEAADRVKQLEALEEKKRARELYVFAKQRRLDETRKKILLGALAEHLMQKDQNFRQFVEREMNAYFTREDDRKLLGLPAQKAPAPAPAPAPARRLGGPNSLAM